MAKKRAAKQSTFCNSFDELPQDVKDAAHVYTTELDERMSHQTSENDARGKLIAAMETHKIKKIPDPEHDGKFLELTVTDPKPKIKRVAGEVVVPD